MRFLLFSSNQKIQFFLQVTIKFKMYNFIFINYEIINYYSML